MIGTFGGAQRSTSVLLNEIASRADGIDVKALLVDGTDERFMSALECCVDRVNVPFSEYLFVVRKGSIKSGLSVFLLTIRVFLYFLFFKGKASVLCNSSKALFILSIVKLLLWWKLDINFYSRGWGRKKDFPAYSVFLLNFICNKIFCVSTQTFENMKFFVKKESRFYITYTSVDLEGLPEKETCLYEGHGVLDILYAGAIIPAKGVDRILKAIGVLDVDLKSRIAFRIAGDYSKNIQYYQACQSLIEDLCVNAEWLGWRNDVPELIANSDAVCLISDTEGMPRIIQESMSIGALAIATPVGGISDLVKTGETGYLLSDNTAEELAGIIEGVLVNGIDQRIIDRAKAHVKENFSLDGQVENFINALMA